MKRIAVLPTMVTLGNGLCGFGAVGCLVKAQTGGEEIFAAYMEWACLLILAAMVFDALDGSVARLARVSSEFGGQLDSLADVISFGLAPALTIMVVASYEGFLQRVGRVTGSLFLVCTMLRLARYNVESREHEGPTLYFAGLPTPAAAGLVASLALMHFNVRTDRELGFIAAHLQPMMAWMVRFLPLVAAVAALLMVSRVPYMHLINHVLRDQEPFDYVVRVILMVLFAVFTWPFSLPLAFSIYVAWGLLASVRRSVAQTAAVRQGR